MNCLDCPALPLPRHQVRERCCADRTAANLRDTDALRREHPDVTAAKPGARAQRRRAAAILRKSQKVVR